MTPSGPRPLGGLRIGDLLLTHGTGAQPVLGLWSRRLAPEMAARDPDLAPRRLAPHGLGIAGPRAALHVAPLAGIWHPDGGLVVARDLPQAPAIALQRPMTFVQILLPRHSLISANGLLVETLHPARLGTAPADLCLRLDVAARLPLDQAHDPSLYGPELGPRLRNPSTPWDAA